MILRELFVRLGLDVDAASFAEGAAAVELVKAGLGLVADAANSVAEVFVENVDAAGGWERDLGEAADKTSEHFAKAAADAKNVSEYVTAQIKRLWAGALSYALPVIQTLTDYVRANIKFYGDQFARLAEYITKNWDTIKVALLVGAAAITAAMVAIHWASVKAAVASAAAWLAAAWPFILIGGLIGGILLLLDDIRVYMEGGDSLIGRWMKKWRALVDQWSKAPADKRPWWYSILVAITKEGAIEGWFASVKAWVGDLWASIKGIDWSPITGMFSWLLGLLGDIDWKKFGLEAKAAILTIAAEVKSVDFKSWVLRIEAFLLKLEYAYLVAKNLVRMVGRGFDALSGLGRSVGGAGEWARDLFRRQRPPERGEEEGAEGRPRASGEAPRARGAAATPIMAPGAGVLQPDQIAQAVFEPGPANFVMAQPVAQPPAAPIIRQEITHRNEWNITQRPGENSEAFAQRVLELYDERQSANNEAAAAALPATE